MPSATRDRVPNLLAGLLAASLAFCTGISLVGHDRERPTSPGQHLPYVDIAMIDQDGANRTIKSWSGRLIVLDFVYTSCGDMCPVKTSQLADIQHVIGPNLRNRVEFVSVSIDPEHDTPAALKAYAARNGADLSNWSFLTGDLGAVARFAAAFEAELDSDNAAGAHITTVRLLDGNGRALQRYSGEPVDQMHLLRDIAAQSSEHDQQASNSDL